MDMAILLPNPGGKVAISVQVDARFASDLLFFSIEPG
jgi:hypothetical protein